MSKEDERLVLKFIQDLKWVLESPSLLSNSFFPSDTINLNLHSELFVRLRNYFLPKCETLDFSFNEILSFILDRSTNRLGKYYEFLLEFLFIKFPEIDLIQKGLPLREDHSKTIGEFDFILFDRMQNKILHLEVAVKFYLKLYKENLPKSYIGPSFNDRLDKKMSKLVKQTRLSELEPAKTLLKSVVLEWHLNNSKHLIKKVEQTSTSHKDIQNNKIQLGHNFQAQLLEKLSIQKVALIQGRLFYPYLEDKMYPESLNPEHNKSFFITFNQLSTQRKFLRKFLILPRLDWLSLPSSLLWSQAYNFRSLEKLLSQQMQKFNTSIYVLSKDFNSKVQCFFVLPDSIPPLP